MKKPIEKNYVVLQTAVFTTAIGPVEIWWTQRGLVKVRTPDASQKIKTIAVAKGQPRWVNQVVDGIQKIASGTSFDFSEVPLESERITPFFLKVYTHTRKVPFGKVTSYLQLAKKAGSPKGSRAVGQAMARNPWPFVVPCHRVLSATGKLGGFSMGEGPKTKALLLRGEGIIID